MYITLTLSSCRSSTPKCIEDTWSYAEDIQTRIDPGTDLQITLLQYSPNVVVTNPGEEDQYGSLTSKVTVYGDGRVVREGIFYFYDQAEEDKQTREKQITPEQLQQIVTIFEEANFYAITVGCNGTYIEITDVTMLDIIVSNGEMVHEVRDHGACYMSSFDRYCDLWGQINEIIGEIQ